MERSTYGIPEREGYPLRQNTSEESMQSVWPVAVRYPQDAVWKVAPELEC